MKELIYRIKRKYFPATVKKLLEFGNQRSAGFMCGNLKIVFSKDGKCIYEGTNFIGIINFGTNPLTEDLLNRKVASYWIEGNYFVIKVFKTKGE